MLIIIIIIIPSTIPVQTELKFTVSMLSSLFGCCCSTKEPVYREEEEAFLLWWSKTPLGRRKQRVLEMELERM